MKPTLLPLVVLFACVALQAADDPRLAAVRAADDQRAAAIVAADGAKLSAIFSDELRYAHSSGLVDTKTSYLQSIVSGRTKYHVIEFEERNFTFPAPGIALEGGRVHMKPPAFPARLTASSAWQALARRKVVTGVFSPGNPANFRRLPAPAEKAK